MRLESMSYSILLVVCFDVFVTRVTSQSCVPSSDPLVRCTNLGSVRGIKSDFYINITNSSTTTTIEKRSVHAFLGIPYAEPPSGERRFRRPEPKTPWPRGTIFNATSLPNSCYHMIIEYFNTTGEKIWAPVSPLSEDCLYLNIWAPVTARQQQQQPLAVMIWIYGGGFTTGSVSMIDCQYD